MWVDGSNEDVFKELDILNVLMETQYMNIYELNEKEVSNVSGGDGWMNLIGGALGCLVAAGIIAGKPNITAQGGRARNILGLGKAYLAKEYLVIASKILLSVVGGGLISSGIVGLFKKSDQED